MEDGILEIFSNPIATPIASQLSKNKVNAAWAPKGTLTYDGWAENIFREDIRLHFRLTCDALYIDKKLILDNMGSDVRFSI